MPEARIFLAPDPREQWILAVAELVSPAALPGEGRCCHRCLAFLRVDSTRNRSYVGRWSWTPTQKPGRTPGLRKGWEAGLDQP